MTPEEADADERYDRERRFHDERYADEHRLSVGKYYAVDAGRRRYVELVHDAASEASSVLEYGCGQGSMAFDLADGARSMVGIDISDVAIQQARDRARREGVDAHFEQDNAEALGFPDQSFDLVIGSGILHHLDLERASKEIRRVLRPGGRAVFYEPLGTNPAINLYRRLTPSLRTPDEHPLVPADFEMLGRHFVDVTTEYFNLLALLASPVARRPWGSKVVRLLQEADRRLFDRFPLAERLAWVAVLSVRASHSAVR